MTISRPSAFGRGPIPSIPSLSSKGPGYSSTDTMARPPAAARATDPRLASEIAAPPRASSSRWSLHNPYGSGWESEISVFNREAYLKEKIPAEDRSNNLAAKWGYDPEQVFVDGRLNYLLKTNSSGFFEIEKNQTSAKALIEELGASAIYFTPRDGFAGGRGVLVLIGEVTYNWVDALSILSHEQKLKTQG